VLVLDKAVEDENEIESFVAYCQNWLLVNGMFRDHDGPDISDYTSIRDIGIDLQLLYLHLIDPDTPVIFTPHLVSAFDIIDEGFDEPRVFSESDIPDLDTEPLGDFTFDSELATGLANLSRNGFEFSAQLILAARIQCAVEPSYQWSQVEGYFQYLGLVFRHSVNLDIENQNRIVLPVKFFNRLNHDASEEVKGAVFAGYLMNEKYPREERSNKAQNYLNESQTSNFEIELAITLAVLQGSIDAPKVNSMMVPAIRAVLTNNYVGGAYYEIWEISVPISIDFLNWAVQSFIDAYTGNKVPKSDAIGWSFEGAWSKKGGLVFSDRQLLVEYLSQGSPNIELSSLQIDSFLHDVLECIPDGQPQTDLGSD